MKTIDELCVTYVLWNKEQGLDLGSADEHVLDDELTDAQRAWLIDFSCQWDAAIEYERNQAEAEAEAFRDGREVLASDISGLLRAHYDDEGERVSILTRYTTSDCPMLRVGRENGEVFHVTITRARV